MGAYPDNQFLNDQLEPDQYGGSPTPGIFDWLAWTWITGLVRNISKVILSNVRVSYTNSVVVVQHAVVPGDVLAIDLSQSYTDPTTQLKVPFVDKYSTIVSGGGIPKVIGVAVVTTSALGRCQYATGGLLPQAISGLSGQTGGTMISVNPANSRLRVWQVGDDTLGYTDPNGNILLVYPGHVV